MPGDEEGIVFVRKNTWLVTYPSKENNITREDILAEDFDSPKKIKEWKESLKNNGKGTSCVFVAKKDDKIIGICVAGKCGSHNELRVLYVLPEYQKMGIGTKLAEEAIMWMGRAKDIILTVACYNKNAIGFYKKMGFTDTGDRSFKKLSTNKEIPEIKMKLRRL